MPSYKKPTPKTVIDPDTGEARPVLPEFKAEPLALAAPAKRIRGARRVLSSQEVDAFCRALNQPTTFEVACGIIGVPERTMREWLSKDVSEIHEDDEWQVELQAKYAQTMAGGQRKALVGMGMEMAADDPNLLKFMMQALIPSMNPVKKLEAKVETTAAPTKTLDFSLCSDDELRVIEAAERIYARLRALT